MADDATLQIGGESGGLVGALERGAAGFEQLFLTITGGVAAGEMLHDTLDKMGEKLGEFIGEAIKFLPESVNHISETAIALGKYAATMSTTVENASILSQIADRTNTSMDQTATAVYRLNARLEDTGAKGDKAAEALTRAGLSADEMRQMDPAEAYLKLISALHDTGDAASVAADLFGSKFGKNILAITSYDIPDMMESITDLNMIVTQQTVDMARKYDEGWANLTGVWKAAEMEIGQALIPAFAGITDMVGHIAVDAWKQLQDANSPLMLGLDQLRIAFYGAANGSTFAQQVFDSFVNILLHVVDAVGVVIQAAVGLGKAWYEAKTVFDAVGYGVTGLGAAFDQLIIAVLNVGSKLPGIGGMFAGMLDGVKQNLITTQNEQAKWGAAIDANQDGIARLDTIGKTATVMVDQFKGSLIENAKTMRDNLNTSDDTAAATGRHANATKAAKEQTDAWTQSVDALYSKLAGNDARTELARVTEAYYRLEDAGQLNDQTMKALADAYGNVRQYAESYDTILEDIYRAYQKVLPSHDLFKTGMLDLSSQAFLAGQGVLETTMRINGMSKAESDYIAGVKDAGFQTIEQLQAISDHAETQYEFMLEHSDHYRDVDIENARLRAEAALKALDTEAGPPAIATWNTFLDQQTTVFAKLAQVMGDSFGGAAKSIATIMGAADAGGKAAEGLHAGLLKAADGEHAMRDGAVAVMGALPGMIGAMDAATQSGSKMMNAVGGAAAGAQMGAQFGGAWGAAIGGAVGFIVGLFRGKPEWQQIAQDSMTAFGVGISDQLAKQMADLEQKISATAKQSKRQVAEDLSLDKIIAEAGGVTGDNIKMFETRAAQLFDVIKVGGDTGKLAVKELGTVMGEFGKSILDTGKVADQVFVDILKRAQADGDQLAQVTSFLSSETAKMAAGNKAIADGFMAQTAQDFKTMTGLTAETTATLSKADQDYLSARAKLETQYAADHRKAVEGGDAADVASVDAKYQAMRDKLLAFSQTQEGFNIKDVQSTADANAKIVANYQTEFDRVSRITLASFNAEIASGKDAATAISDIGPTIDDLSNAAVKFGFQGNDAYDKLRQWRQLTTDNAGLLQSVSGVNDMMVAMSNIGELDTSTFKDMQAQGLDTYKKLMDAGFSQQQAEAQMKPLLMSVIDLHNKRGMAIDDETAKLIAQSEQDGVITSKEANLNDILMQGLGALIKAVGGDLPKAWQDMAGSAENAAGRATNATTNTLKPAIIDASGQLTATPWEGYASRAQWAAAQAAQALPSVGAAARDAAGQVANSGGAFDNWRRQAVDDANSVYDAVNRVSVGASPGGIKDIANRLHDAIAASRDWRDNTVSHAADVYDAVNRITGGAGGPGVGVNVAATTSIRAQSPVVVQVSQPMFLNEQTMRQFADIMMQKTAQSLTREMTFEIAPQQ